MYQLWFSFIPIIKKSNFSMYKLWLFVHIVKKFKYYIYMNPLADNQNIHSLLRYELQQSLYMYIFTYIFYIKKQTLHQATLKTRTSWFEPKWVLLHREQQIHSITQFMVCWSLVTHHQSQNINPVSCDNPSSAQKNKGESPLQIQHWWKFSLQKHHHQS